MCSLVWLYTTRLLVLLLALCFSGQLDGAVWPARRKKEGVELETESRSIVSLILRPSYSTVQLASSMYLLADYQRRNDQRES